MQQPQLLLEGKYEILSKIREGGMGTIYHVRHRLLDEIRVVKVMQPHVVADLDLKRRFLEEAKTAIRLKHPNICTIYDFAVDENGTAYLVMEFIDGVTLADFLRLHGCPGVPLTLEIAHQALLALGYLHRKGVIHRDVAPDNLMLTHDDEGRRVVKLIDLGIAKTSDRAMDATATGVFLGKLKYASPEQYGTLSPEMKLDGRSDLYGLGVVLYELLTGTRPFLGESPAELLRAHLFLPPISFSESDREGKVPPELRDVIFKSLEKNREDRYATAEEFDREIVGLRERYARPDDLESTLAILSTIRSMQPAAPDAVRPSAQERLDRQFGQLATPSPSAPPLTIALPDAAEVEKTAINPRTAAERAAARKSPPDEKEPPVEPAPAPAPLPWPDKSTQATAPGNRETERIGGTEPADRPTFDQRAINPVMAVERVSNEEKAADKEPKYVSPLDPPSLPTALASVQAETVKKTKAIEIVKPSPPALPEPSGTLSPDGGPAPGRADRGPEMPSLPAANRPVSLESARPAAPPPQPGSPERPAPRARPVVADSSTPPAIRPEKVAPFPGTPKGPTPSDQKPTAVSPGTAAEKAAPPSRTAPTIEQRAPATSVTAPEMAQRGPVRMWVGLLIAVAVTLLIWRPWAERRPVEEKIAAGPTVVPIAVEEKPAEPTAPPVSTLRPTAPPQPTALPTLLPTALGVTPVEARPFRQAAETARVASRRAKSDADQARARELSPSTYQRAMSVQKRAEKLVATGADADAKKAFDSSAGLFAQAEIAALAQATRQARPTAIQVAQFPDPIPRRTAVPIFPTPIPVQPTSRPAEVPRGAPVEKDVNPAPPPVRAGSAQEPIRETVRLYERAWSRFDARLYKRVYPDGVAAFEMAVKGLKSQYVRIEIQKIDVDASGTGAVVTGHETIVITPKAGEEKQDDHPVTLGLEKQGDRWIIVRRS